MPEAATFPTRREEAWRYSDTDALSALDLGRAGTEGQLVNGAGQPVPGGREVSLNVFFGAGLLLFGHKLSFGMRW